MRKGSGIPAVDNHLRIPEGIYQKLVDRVKQTKCRSINRMVIDLLTKALEAEEAKQKVVS